MAVLVGGIDARGRLSEHTTPVLGNDEAGTPAM